MYTHMKGCITATVGIPEKKWAQQHQMSRWHWIADNANFCWYL